MHHLGKLEYLLCPIHRVLIKSSNTRNDRNSPREDAMITRRRVLEAAGTGAALAAAAIGLRDSVDAAPLNLPAALPEGLRNRRDDGGAARQEAADQAHLPAAQLRDADRIFPHARSRRTTRSSCAITSSDIPRGRRQDLEDRGRRRRRQRHRPSSRSTISRRCRPPRWSAVSQCSGNRRGLFQPHVPGVEWGYGAMGCARWKGARLKDVLDKVGPQEGGDRDRASTAPTAPVDRQDAGLRQEHSGLEGDRGHDADRLRDERRSRCRT